MRRPKFQRALVQSIAFAALSLSLFLNVFGQNAPGSQCAAEDYECYVRGYTAAISISPKNAEYYYSRGASYVKLKKFDEALQDFDKAIDLNPKFGEAYSGRGYVYIAQVLYVEAAEEFNKALKLNPTNSDALKKLEFCLFSIGVSDSAFKDFNRLIEADPNNAQYYNARANERLQFRDITRAVEDSSKAIELKLKYADAYLTRAQGYCHLIKKKESESDIAKYEELTGKPSKYECVLDPFDCADSDYDCQIFVHTDRISLIIRKNVRFNMYLFDEYSDRGYAYYKKGDYDSALGDFNKSMGDSNKPLGKHSVYRDRFYRGNIYLRKGKYDEALVDLKEALRIRGDSSEANLGIGEIYLHQNYYETALDYFNQAILLNSGLGKAYFGRGTIYLKFGDDYNQSGIKEDESKAVEAYRQAVKDFDAVIDTELNNAPPETYLRRAKAYEKLGETEKAANDRAKYQELSEKP